MALYNLLEDEKLARLGAQPELTGIAAMDIAAQEMDNVRHDRGEKSLPRFVVWLRAQAGNVQRRNRGGI